MRSKPLLLLMACGLAMAATLVWLWITPQGQVRDEVHWREPAALRADYGAMVPAVSVAAAPDAQQFLGMLDRPLFTLTRRPPLPPPPPKAVEAPPPPDNLSAARLQAIFDVPGEGGSVILLVAGKSRRVRVNAAVDGWVLKSIEGQTVSFVQRGQTRVLRLQRGALTTYAGLGMPATGGVASPAAAAAAPGAANTAAERGAARPTQTPAPSRSRPTFGGGR